MYHHRTNLIIGFHGCDKSVRDQLLNLPNKIQKSEKPYDWLGNGVYFWENNYERALSWAQDKKARNEIKEPTVIGAVLHLGNCLDLMDSKYIEMLKVYYELMNESYQKIGKELPNNKDSKKDIHLEKILRELDCAVIEFMHDEILSQIVSDKTKHGYSKFELFDSTRGVFTEGWPGVSWSRNSRKEPYSNLCKKSQLYSRVLFTTKRHRFLSDIC